MAVMSFDELNTLSTTDDRKKAGRKKIPIHNYFENMQISEENKEKRVRLANLLLADMLFLWKRGLVVCAGCGKAMVKHSNGNYYRCRVHKYNVSRMELEKNVLECVKAMALAGLQDLELKKKQEACKDTLPDEISLLEKALEKYNREKFTVYDEYTKGKLSREVMAERNVNIRKQIEETQKLIDEKREEAERQDAGFGKEDTENLSVLSMLEEFDPDKIRLLVSQVLVYSEAEIEIIWNVDDFITQM